MIKSSIYSIVKVKDGEQGVGVAQIKPQYYLSSSKVEPTGGTWLDDRPDWISGYYMWTRTCITYTDGRPVEYTDPICDTTWEAVEDLREDVDEKFTDYSTTSQMTAAIEIAKDSVTTSAAQIYATKGEVDTVSDKVVYLETWKTEASQKITKDGIIATVGNYYAYESDLQSAEKRITTAESTITQHTDEIALRVEKDGVISAINQTAETITIDASKINLSGYVTMTNLATAGQTVIDGANITTGKISADRLDVDGIFAKDITATGTITGVNLVGATGSFSGAITTSNIVATGGTIGGWSIRSDNIQNTNSSGNLVYLMNGTNANQDVLVVRTGAGTTASPYSWPVYIRANGQVGLGNANVTGAITATSIKANDKYQLTVNSNTKTIISGSNFAENIMAPVVRFGILSDTHNSYIQFSGTPVEDQTGGYTEANLYASHFNVNASLHASGEIVSTASANAFRAVYGNYGFFIRNDGNDTYFMLTNSGDQYGNWNSYRPITINNSTGAVSINGVTVKGHTHNSIFAYGDGTQRLFYNAGNNFIPTDADGTSNPGVTNLGSSTNYYNSLHYSGSLTKKSDRRDKNDLGTLSEAETLTLLRGVEIEKFTSKRDNLSKTHYGIYAQDFRDLLIVSGIGYVSALDIEEKSTEQKTTDIYSPESEVTYGIDYGQFTPLLMKGWQYHDSRIQYHDSQIYALEQQVISQQCMLEQAFTRIEEQNKLIKSLQASA